MDELKRGYVINDIVESRKETGYASMMSRGEILCSKDYPVFQIWCSPANITVIRGQSLRNLHVSRKKKIKEEQGDGYLAKTNPPMTSHRKCLFQPDSSCIAIQSGWLDLSFWMPLVGVSWRF